MKIKSQISFLLVTCILFACQTSHEMLYRSKPQRVLESQTDYSEETGKTSGFSNKTLDAQNTAIEVQIATTETFKPQEEAMLDANENKPLATKSTQHRPITIKRQITQTIAPFVKTQTPNNDVVGSTGFFGSVGHAFAVVGLVFLVVGLIFFLMGNIISVSIGAFFIGIGLVFLLIWLVLFIIQSVFDVIL